MCCCVLIRSLPSLPSIFVNGKWSKTGGGNKARTTSLSQPSSAQANWDRVTRSEVLFWAPGCIRNTFDRGNAPVTLIKEILPLRKNEILSPISWNTASSCSKLLDSIWDLFIKHHPLHRPAVTEWLGQKCWSDWQRGNRVCGLDWLSWDRSYPSYLLILTVGVTVHLSKMVSFVYTKQMTMQRRKYACVTEPPRDDLMGAKSSIGHGLSDVYNCTQSYISKQL